MRTWSFILARTGLALLGLIAVGCGAAAQTPPPATSSATPASSVPNEWPMYGQNAARTGLNAGETAIVAASVGRLVPGWEAFIGQGPLPPSGSPAVAAGRVFVGSSVTEGDNFFAFDAASGRTLWTADVGHWPTDDSVGIGAGAAVAGDVVVAGGGDAAHYGVDAPYGAFPVQHDLAAVPGGLSWASRRVADVRV